MIELLKNFNYHKELIEILLKPKIAPVSSNFAIPVFMFFLFKNEIPLNILSIWLGVNFIIFILRMYMSNKILNILDIASSDKIRNYMKIYIFIVFLSASTWGIFSTISYLYMDEVNTYIVVVVLLAILTGSTSALSSVFHASFVFVSTIVLFMIFNFIYFGNTTTHVILALLLILFMYIVTSANNKMYRLLKDNIDQKNKSVEFNKFLKVKVKEVTKESNKKEELLQKQSALVQMGEMISMIAHQWRQPLGAIVAVSIDLKMQMELDSFDLSDEKQRDECQKYFSDSLKDIDSLVQNMTSTIDDFRNFYKPNKAYSVTSVSVPIEKAINMVKNSFKSDGITIIEKYNSVNAIDMYVNELMQVILNILKNSQDNFKETNKDNKSILFICEDTDYGVLIKICDNGGGINDDVLPKVFNPYFSTKDEKNGTGLGLYMSKIIIEEHHFGKLEVYNTNDGACFAISLNKKIIQE